MSVISIPDTEVYEKGAEGFYTNTEGLSQEKKTIIKNVSTRRNLNLNPWANHEFSLSLSLFLSLSPFFSNNPIWGVEGRSQ